MRLFATLAGLCLVLAHPAMGQSLPTIGVAAPLSGPSAGLGRHMAAGAGEAAGETARVVAADTACTAEGGAAAARKLIEEGASIVVGFLCTAEIEAALPILGQAGIPVIDVGVRANRLTDRRERTGHLVWRVAPRTDEEAEAIASFVRSNWRDTPFGIVEDGSVNARDLADEVRARLGPQSIEPALVDNYRPAEQVQFALARRIAQSEVTRLLVFGTRGDVAIVSRDAAETGLELEIVGGESLIDEPGEGPALEIGTRAIAIDDAAGDYPAETGAVVREGYHAPAFAATQIALAALERARGQSIDLGEALDGAPFETILGAIGFDERGDSTRTPFDVLVWDGESFVPAPQS